ncbi:hypothetical protein LXL04_000068 [Taraxacum kok-saghyz]
MTHFNFNCLGNIREIGSSSIKADGDFNLTHSKDRWTLMNNPQESYTTSGLRREFLKKINEGKGDTNRWISWIPKRINILVWRIFKKRMPLRTSLNARGVTLNTTHCPWCANHEETPMNGDSVDELWTWSLNIQGPKKRIKGAQLAIASIFKGLWEIRNEKFFITTNQLPEAKFCQLDYQNKSKAKPEEVDNKELLNRKTSQIFEVQEAKPDRVDVDPRDFESKSLNRKKQQHTVEQRKSQGAAKEQRSGRRAQQKNNDWEEAQALKVGKDREQRSRESSMETNSVKSPEKLCYVKFIKLKKKKKVDMPLKCPRNEFNDKIFLADDASSNPKFKYMKSAIPTNRRKSKTIEAEKTEAVNAKGNLRKWKWS